MLEDIYYGLIHPGDADSLPTPPDSVDIIFSLPHPGIKLSILIFLCLEVLAKLNGLVPPYSFTHSEEVKR